MIFMTASIEYIIRDLGKEFILKFDVFTFFKTNDARRKRVISLNDVQASKPIRHWRTWGEFYDFSFKKQGSDSPCGFEIRSLDSD